MKGRLCTYVYFFLVYNPEIPGIILFICIFHFSPDRHVIKPIVKHTAHSTTSKSLSSFYWMRAFFIFAASAPPTLTIYANFHLVVLQLCKAVRFSSMWIQMEYLQVFRCLVCDFQHGIIGKMRVQYFQQITRRSNRNCGDISPVFNRSWDENVTQRYFPDSTATSSKQSITDSLFPKSSMSANARYDRRSSRQHRTRDQLIQNSCFIAGRNETNMMLELENAQVILLLLLL